MSTVVLSVNIMKSLDGSTHIFPKSQNMDRCFEVASEICTCPSVGNV